MSIHPVFLLYQQSGRRRGWFDAEMNPDIVTDYHLSGGSSKILRGETSIIPNDQALLSETGLLKILRYGLSTKAHIVEGEIIRDNPPPPIGAKSNWISHSNLLARLYFVVLAIGESFGILMKPGIRIRSFKLSISPATIAGY